MYHLELSLGDIPLEMKNTNYECLVIQISSNIPMSFSPCMYPYTSYEILISFITHIIRLIIQMYSQENC